MPYKLKINGLQYEAEIEGAQDWARSVTRDFNDRIFRTRGDYRFVGHKGLYDLLYNHITLNGVCEALEARIYFNTGTDWDYEWRGDILPQDIEYDLLKRSADGQVLDSSWSAKFNNAQDQKVFMKGQTSKRGNAISPATSQLCDFFTPSTGAYDQTDRECYRVFDIFTYLVDYYSDGTVTFASSFFDTGGDGEQYYITTGKEIRTGDQNCNPEISFSELYDEMNKKCNLWIVIEGTQDAPILKIEEQSYVFQNQLLLTITDPENLKMTTDLDQLFSIIKVGGSNSVEYNGTDANYPTIRFRAWNDEQYNTPGDCEFENATLDLVSGYQIDTNALEQIIESNAEDFDDNIFIVEIDPSTQNAYQFTTDFTGVGTVAYIYNYNLTNSQVLIAWFNGIPQEIVDDVGGDNYYALVNNPVPNYITIPNAQRLDYTNDTISPAEDAKDIYTTASEAGGGDIAGQFKSPQNAIYTIKGSASITANDPGIIDVLPQDIFVRMRALVYQDNTEGTLIQTIDYDNSSLLSIGETDTIYAEGEIFLGIDQVLVIQIIRTSLSLFPNYYTINSAYMSIDTTGPQNLTTAPDDPLIFVYDAAQFKLSRTDFDTLDQGRGFVRILDTNAKKAYDVYARDVKYNSTTGTVEVAEFIGGKPPYEVCWVLETGTWDDACYWLDNELINTGFLCDTFYLTNPLLSGNPVNDWTRVGGSQTGSDPARFNLGVSMDLRQVITIPNGTYRIYYKITDNTTAKIVGVTQSVTVGSISASLLYSNADQDNEGYLEFTASGVTASTYELTFTASALGITVQVDYLFLCQVA